MSHRVGSDAHRRSSQFAILDQDGQLRQQTRVDHEPGTIQAWTATQEEVQVVRELRWAKYHGQWEAAQHAQKSLHPGRVSASRGG